MWIVKHKDISMVTVVCQYNAQGKMHHDRQPKFLKMHNAVL